MSLRPEHERKEIVAEPRQHRLRVEEDHRDRVRRKKLVVLFRRDQRLIGTRKLQTDHKRFQSADDEEDERRDEITDARSPCDRRWRSSRRGRASSPRISSSEAAAGESVAGGHDPWDAIVFGRGHDRSYFSVSKKRADAVQLRPGKLGPRHQGARLLALRVGDPGGQVARIVGQGSRRDRRARHEMREVRTDMPIRTRSADRVTGGAALDERRLSRRASSDDGVAPLRSCVCLQRS